MGIIKKIENAFRVIFDIEELDIKDIPKMTREYEPEYVPPLVVHANRNSPRMKYRRK